MKTPVGGEEQKTNCERLLCSVARRICI